MDTKERLALITRNLEEILTKEDLEMFLEHDVPLKHYIGLEISGKVHLGTGIVVMQKIKDFMDAGIDCSIFLADWHSWINEKLGGDLETIRRVAANYFQEALKAGFLCVGGDPTTLKFVLGKDLYHHNDAYWETLVEIAKHVTLSRVRRSIDILGREEKEDIDFAKLIYPIMQVADIFGQGITLAHAGMDQRKAHVIARDVATKLTMHPLRGQGGKVIAPVALHHHIVMGLQKPSVWPLPQDKDAAREVLAQLKMSKSKPNSAIFIHDTPDEIRGKIKDAFCPPQEIAFNPIADFVKTLIFGGSRNEFRVARQEKFGGAIVFSSYSDFEREYKDGTVHPEDLKNAVAEELIRLLEPARKYFDQPRQKEMLSDMDTLLKKA